VCFTCLVERNKQSQFLKIKAAGKMAAFLLHTLDNHSEVLLVLPDAIIFAPSLT